ncbi:MAG: hypothetical protein IKS83_05715 [Victivallales bacterium]|nr:hypothetical protein [Victivallales bacterium]
MFYGLRNGVEKFFDLPVNILGISTFVVFFEKCLKFHEKRNFMGKRNGRTAKAARGRKWNRKEQVYYGCWTAVPLFEKSAPWKNPPQPSHLPALRESGPVCRKRS